MRGDPDFCALASLYRKAQPEIGRANTHAHTTHTHAAFTARVGKKVEQKGGFENSRTMHNAITICQFEK